LAGAARMSRFILILCLSLISGKAAESRSSPQPVRLAGVVQNLTPLSSFCGRVVAVDTDPRYALTMRLESVTGATNFAAGQIVTFAIHSASKLFSGEPTKGKTYQMELDRRVDHGKVIFSGLRLRAANQPRQPAPVGRLSCIRASLARRGCAFR
jgi:hypothetical protein